MTKNGSLEITVMSPETYDHAERHMRYVIPLRGVEHDQKYYKQNFMTNEDVRSDIYDLLYSLKNQICEETIIYEKNEFYN